jgi:hypothetical protein
MSLGLGPSTGALIVYFSGSAARKVKGKQIQVWLNGEASSKVYSSIMDRRINGKKRCAAVFQSLPPGNHQTVEWAYRRFTVYPGQVAEIEVMSVKV